MFVEHFSLAAVCFGLYVAYLRLDPFRYKDRVRDAAKRSLTELEGNAPGGLEQYSKREYILRLRYLAGEKLTNDEIEHASVPWLIKFMTHLWDRLFAYVGVVASGVVLIISAHNRTQTTITIALDPNKPKHMWVFWVLAGLILLLLVLSESGEWSTQHAQKIAQKAAHEAGEYTKSNAGSVKVGEEGTQ